MAVGGWGVPVLIGERELRAKLARLGLVARRGAVASGIRAGMTVVAKEFRRQINTTSVDTPHATSLKRGMRKSIGKRFEKKAGTREYAAKVGYGVGKRGGKRFERLSAGKTRGVGVSATNVHWFVLGTKERQGRGKIEALFEDVAQRAASASAGPALARMVQKTKERILREAQRRR